MDNDRRDGSDAFDDLFEPFDLEEGPPQQQQPQGQASREQAAVPGPGYALPCPSCGSPNPPDNRHCEACGARITQARMPVAPQPMLRTTAGARALMVLAGVILTVAALALVVNVFRSGDSTAGETTTTTTTSIPLEVKQLIPAQTICSSELTGFPCEALTDDDPTNRWNATEGGVGAEITLLFTPAVQITEIFIDNVRDEEAFRRNARIKGVEISTDDLVQSRFEELDDTNEPQKIRVESIRTFSLTLTITSTYPGQTYEGKEPFPELATQQITVYGRVSPDAAG